MNDEQKYKDALERAKRMFSEKELNYLFPELKESEDEKIRKEIIEYIKTGTDHKNWVAWLDKQGEQPTDKIKTKFHEGDWISGYNTNYKVLSVNNEGYLVDTDGNKFNILFENEKFHHLWTIQDAKDGDVLASKDGFDILIFRHLDTNISFSSYYNIKGHLEIGWSNNCFIPATKEQRDLLFQKMAEAGYEWDSEKKELKKIEPKTLDADKVIEWLECDAFQCWGEPIDIRPIITKFKKDFEL